ncbi:F0F1 ATP synthase subunit alpha [Candidatus Woesebacteria bacterium]|nr:F0F1 ATP synthase subunit alpha [Candidatus Woesebacteria bacterium]
MKQLLGEVIAVADGIAWVSFPKLTNGHVVLFENKVQGLVMSVGERSCVLILGDPTSIRSGMSVTTTNTPLSVPVGDALLGRVINPLGVPLDGEPLETDETLPVERPALSIAKREPVNEPLSTGVLAVDAMIPIGRGQRELLIGDRGTGKTTLAIDTIINQKKTNVLAVYVAIGQKRSDVASLIERLIEEDALSRTVVVAADASTPAAFWYIAPFAGATIAESLRESGRDVVIIYDDLTKHAWSYREISLLMGRPAGREAYPGDVFYLHSRLLERANKRAKEFGGGSITALPIIETQAGDVGSYIPTNVISITDGQVYFETDLFFKGIRPAVNPGLSVSRVGGTAQTKAIKKLSGKLRLTLSQYWELTGFSQFGGGGDKTIAKKLLEGERLLEALKQNQGAPYNHEQEVALLYLVQSGFLQEIDLSEVKAAMKSYISRVVSNEKLAHLIEEKQELTPEVVAGLDEALVTLKKQFVNS